MFNLTELKTGDFIDVCSYFDTMEGNEELITKFFNTLIGRLPESESECLEIISNFANQITEIKESFEFIYNPPSLPSSTEAKRETIGDEYRKEFSLMYGGYVSLVVLVCQKLNYNPDQIKEIKTQDFLFWANYFLHHQFVENIK